MKTSNLSADNFKKILDLDGSTPKPAIRSGDTGQRIPCFDSCQLITKLMCNMCAISCAPKLARKCEIEPWIPRGADGRAGGVRSRDYQTLWDGQISLAIGLARVELRYKSY